MSRDLYTVAFPTLPAAAERFIDDFRADHDSSRRDLVAPHFTLVFACREVPLEVYTRHVEAVAQSIPPIDFECRIALPAAGAPGGSAHVFLVPTIGHAGIVELHDRLYEGPLRAALRADLPYVPHITVATTPDIGLAKALCDALNHLGVEVEGRVDHVAVGTVEDGRFVVLSRHPLAAAPLTVVPPG